MEKIVDNLQQNLCELDRGFRCRRLKLGRLRPRIQFINRKNYGSIICEFVKYVPDYSKMLLEQRMQLKISWPKLKFSRFVNAEVCLRKFLIYAAIELSLTLDNLDNVMSCKWIKS